VELDPEVLRAMDEEAQFNAMLEWFGRHYEDPAQSTPYNGREGGYLYIHGGPYDAAEELGERFGHIVPSVVIDRLVEYLEEDGITEWAGRDPGREEEDDGAYGKSAYGAGTYGQKLPISAEEAARRVLALTQEIRAYLAADPIAAAGMGHNNPPEDLEDIRVSPEDRLRLSADLDIVDEEVVKPAPDRTRLILAASNVWGFLSKYAAGLKKLLGWATGVAAGAILAKTAQSFYTVILQERIEGAMRNSQSLQDLVSWFF
jgi:hypothetical protein